ncbi:MAG: sulfatase-like hydrolase/transferase [Bacteroidetes bacterium]|nr:sulfatase-like hydrolase/transferase [Bacteroidota bacterium]
MKFSKPFLVSAAAVFPFMLLLVAPLSFYFGNINELAFGLKDVTLQVSGLFLVLFAILFLLLFLFRRKVTTFSVLAGLLTGLALSVWLQSQLFVWNFGLFRGEMVDWDRWKIQMYLEFATWAVVILLTVFAFLRKNRKVANNILMGIYLVGIISVAAGYVAAPREKNKTPEINDAKQKDFFSFHPKNNVLLIILDTFQSDYFEYITQKYPVEASMFDGFTFYRNTASMFPTTKASLPSIITGSCYLNKNPYDTFISRSNARFNLLDAYKKKSYSAYLAGINGTFPGVLAMQTFVDELSENSVHPFFEYIDFALFRSIPTYFKPVIYNNGIWLFSFLQRRNYPPDNFGVDIRFLELIEKFAFVPKVPESSGTFKILHFSIPHLPVCVDENLKYDPSLTGKEGYLKQARGAVRVAGRVLNTLKRLGIYDNSEIIILSDHGTMNMPQANKEGVNQDTTSLVPPGVITSSHALLLHKPALSRGTLVTNDSPLEITDIACILGLRDGDSACNKYLAAKSGGSRERPFYFYTWDDSWDTENMPQMTEYYISGHVYDKASYRKGRYLYAASGMVEISSNKYYQIGKPVLFSAGGKSDEYILKGWSRQEPDHRWTDGAVAGLVFQLDKKPQRDMVLRLWGVGINGENKKESEKIKLTVNGKQVASWELIGNNKYEALIPAALAPDGLINVEIAISNPKSSANDRRQLGMAVTKLVIDEE